MTTEKVAVTLENLIGYRRHARARPGHPRLLFTDLAKTWMAGTSPAMTTEFFEARGGAVEHNNVSWWLLVLACARTTADASPPASSHRRGEHHLRQQRLALGLGAVALHRRGEAFEDAVFENSSAAARTASSTCFLRPRALAAGEISDSDSSTTADAIRVRKSFSEILMPAISRKYALTCVVDTARTVPDWSRYWNMRLPGTVRRMPIARTSFEAAHSLRTALPPLALKVSTTQSSSSVTLDFKSVVAPRVPFSRA